MSSVIDRVLELHGISQTPRSAEALLDHYHQRRKRFALMDYFNTTGQHATAREMMQTGIIPEPYNSLPPVRKF